jgi:glycine oxidase
VKSWDVIIIGAGIIGLSLAIELNKQGMRVLVVDKGEPGREASWAAGGMLCDFPGETMPGLLELATASAHMYPEFVRELQDESGLKIDLRVFGTLLFLDQPPDPHELDDRGWLARWRELEPNLDATKLRAKSQAGIYLKERSVDPRHLTAAAIAAARQRGVDFSSGNHVLAVEMTNGKASGVRTNKTHFAAGIVVNCAGAWSGQISSDACAGTGASHLQAEQSSTTFFVSPTRPVKGQMLCVIMPEKELVCHVIRTPDVYLIPRSDGRMLIGATAEEAGFDKQTIPETIEKLRQAALDLVPKLLEARFLQAWAGLRPGTPDKLPILGATSTPGYFVATGHFRDGILLAPITAKVMAELITGQNPQIDLSKFSSSRFTD